MRSFLVGVQLALCVIFFVNDVAQAGNDYGLADDIVKELKEAFEKGEKDSNGELTKDKLKPVLQSLWRGLPNDEKFLDELFDSGDCDCNGALGEHEFLQMMAKSVKYATQDDKLKEDFDDFDSDNDGYLSEKEFRALARSKWGGRVSDAEFDEEKRKFNFNSQRGLSFEEYKNVMRKMAFGDN